MAQSASLQRISRMLPADRVWHYIRLAIGGFLTALLAAALTYLATARLNHEAALQQQYLAAVQDFVSTGAQVDAAVTELSDNVLDAEGVKEGRKEARQAIAAHAAATQGLSQVIGTGNAGEYMKGLAKLRTLVDQAEDVQSALKASDARFDVMHNRTIIVAEARRRIFGEEDEEDKGR